MQIFITGTLLETAQDLDPRRLWKQILEVNQIISTISGISDAWKNHPCVIQYQWSLTWLEDYRNTLIHFREGNIRRAELSSIRGELHKPNFHTPEFLDQMKRRLYTKDPSFYSKWSYLGKSDENWYWSWKEQRFIKYINGRKTT